MNTKLWLLCVSLLSILLLQFAAPSYMFLNVTDHAGEGHYDLDVHMPVQPSDHISDQARNDVSIKDGDWLARVETSMGDFTMKLYPNKAPITVSNFMTYANESFYNGLIFHRVIDGFVVQGGGFYPGLIPKAATHPPIPLEPTNVTGLHHLDGAVGMARKSDPNSATTQFYICDGAQPELDAENRTDGGYTVFAQVVEGMSVIRAISAVPTATYGTYNDVPVENITINSVSVYQYRENQPPHRTANIPDLQIHEDQGDGLGVIDLSDYFDDDTGAANLTYVFTYESAPTVLKGSVNGTMMNIIQQKENWFGTCQFVVTAIDRGLDNILGTSDDLTVNSNMFNVTVLPTNDPPTIDRMDGYNYNGELRSISLYQREWYNFTVEGSDIDGDTVVFSSNLTGYMPGFSIQPNGSVSIHGLQENVGTWYGDINASDGNGSFTRGYLKITVYNLNDPPYFVSVNGQFPVDGRLSFAGDAAIKEDSTSNFTIIESDPDGDSLTFTCQGWNGTKEVIDTGNNTWILYLTPHQQQVGTANITLRLSDGNDAVTIEMIVEVQNTNDLPIITAVSGTGCSVGTWNTSTIVVDGTEDTPLSLNITVLDPDADSWNASVEGGEDAVTTSVNTTAAGVLQLDLNPVKDVNGAFNMILYLDDGTGKRAVSLHLNLESVNDPPVVSISPDVPHQVTEGTVVHLKGTASDDSDGVLLCEWRSNLVGRIAKGTEANVTLKPGVHNITFRTTDSMGLSSEAYIQITVVPKDNHTSSQQSSSSASASISTMMWAAAAVVIVVVIVLIVVVLLYLKKKKGGDSGGMDSENMGMGTNSDYNSGSSEYNAGPTEEDMNDLFGRYYSMYPCINY